MSEYNDFYISLKINLGGGHIVYIHSSKSTDKDYAKKIANAIKKGNYEISEGNVKNISRLLVDGGEDGYTYQDTVK